MNLILSEVEESIMMVNDVGHVTVSCTSPFFGGSTSTEALSRSQSGRFLCFSSEEMV